MQKYGKKQENKIYRNQPITDMDVRINRQEH